MAIEILRPNAAGDVTDIDDQFPAAGAHWEKVDEVVADGDTTYLYNYDPGKYTRDLYNLPAHSVGSGTINSVTVYIRVKSGAGGGYFYPCLKSGTTTDDGAAKLTHSYWETFSHQWNANPDDSAAWEWADIDDLQIGIYSYEQFGYTNFCTQVYVEISYAVAIPTVTTGTIPTVKQNVAMGSGNITATGGINCTERGICWNTTGTPTISDFKSESNGSFDTGPFSNLMTGLLPSTHYYVRAYATNTTGTGYGTEVEFDTLAESPLVITSLIGTVKINALDLLSQLNDETVVDYAADKSVSDIVDDLLLLQVNPQPITKGTIDYSLSLKIEIPQDTILGALMRLREILGGYIYVDNDRALQWRTSIGEDKGQQIRYRKNLKGITRTIDYSNFANRLYVYGGDSPATTLADNVMISQISLNSDIGRKWYDSAWQFGLGGLGNNWVAGSASVTSYGHGGGGRFPILFIPAGSTIVSAKVKFYGLNSPNTVIKSRFAGELNATPITFSDLTDYDARSRTTASIDWDAISAWTPDTWYESPELLSVVQEIVDLGGWATGQPLVIFWDDHDDRSDVAAQRKVQTYIPNDYAPMLTVRYTPPAANEYIEDLTSQVKYGGIFTKTLPNKAIMDADTLYEWAFLQLVERKDPYISYSIDIVNLEAAGLSFEALQLGSVITVIDENLGIDVKTQIVRIIRDLTNPLNIQLEIANKSRDIIESLGRDYRWRQANY